MKSPPEDDSPAKKTTPEGAPQSPLAVSAEDEGLKKARDRNESPPANLARQGSIVAAMTMISRISGFLRDIVLAYLFGASQYADMFFVALRIPNFFRRLFAEGAFSQAFVPVLVRYRDQGPGQLIAFVAPLSGLFALILIFVVLLGVVFANTLTGIFAPGFVADAGRFQQTADLVRITFPYLGFISLTAYAGAVLNAHGRFAIPAITPVLLNLCLIGAAFVALANPLFGLGGELSVGRQVEILAWGVLIAGIAQFALQLPYLHRLGVLVKPNLNHQHAGVRQVGKLLVPAVLAASVAQINALVNTILASTLMPGSISWLYYADRLMELPLGLVAVALGTVMLPHLSRQAAANDERGFRQTLDWGVNIALLISMPAAAALYFLAEPLSATVFMSFSSGEITPHDINMIGLALRLFAIALPGFVLVKVLAPAFFAHQDTRAPLRYATGAVAANLVVSLATFSWFGHVGLAWATAISAWVHVILLYAGLRRRGLYRISKSTWPLAWKILAAGTVLAVILMYAIVPLDWMDYHPGKRFGGMLVVALGGVGIYALCLILLGLRPRHLRQIQSANLHSENELN